MTNLTDWPQAARPLFEALAPAFTKPTARRMMQLTLGAILAKGRRTFTGILMTLTGLVQGHFTTFYRLFSRPRWNRWTLARLLARLVIELVPPDERVTVLADTTVSEHRGPKVYGKGKHRDAVRSSHSHTAWRWGHRWVVLAVCVPIPCVSRRWALPVLAALYRPPEVSAAEGRPHKTPGQLAQQLTRVLLGWSPQHRFLLVGDGEFSSHQTARFAHRFARRHRRQLVFVGRFYADAALYDPPPPYSGNGRPRVKGERRPTPQDVVAQAKRKALWKTQVAWYGGGRRRVGLVGGEGHWHKSGFGLVPLRWVYVEDREGTHRPEYFFSTDPAMPLKQIVESYTRRWSIEVTFQEVRAHLGFETTRHWSKAAVERVEPWLLGCFSAVSLIYNEHLRTHQPEIRTWPWYDKGEPTFADAVMTVRRLIWTETVFEQPAYREGMQKLPTDVRDALLNTLTQAI